MLSTEEDSPAQHPELGFKVPILDVAGWVEEARLPPPGMEGQAGWLQPQLHQYGGGLHSVHRCLYCMDEGNWKVHTRGGRNGKTTESRKEDD